MDEQILEKTKTKAANIVRADDVIGKKVINPSKENLGKIYQIVLDKLTGQTIYVVLETGSFLGLGGKLLALPWNAISYDPNEEAFVLNVSKERLQNAPGFDKDHWPNMADKSYGDSLFKYYGTRSYFE